MDFLNQKQVKGNLILMLLIYGMSLIMSERLKILSSSGITGDFDMAINGWSNLPLDVQITLEEINVAELRGESLAKEK